MAMTKKKTFEATGRKLRGLSFEEQQELLRRTTESFFTEKPKRRPLARR
jgi:hypothetical protein